MMVTMIALKNKNTKAGISCPGLLFLKEDIRAPASYAGQIFSPI